MTSVRSLHVDDVMQEILEAVGDAPQVSDVERVNTRSIERMMRQCYALLSQQLERKVKFEPDLYSKDKMNQVLRQFKAMLPDIQSAIATRVADSVSELIRLEVRRVLQDALSDLEDATVREEAQAAVGGPTAATPVAEPVHPAPAPPEAPAAVSGPSEELQPRTAPVPTVSEPVAHEAPAPSPAPAADGRDAGPTEAPSRAALTDQDRSQAQDDTVYQGTVKVSVEAHGRVRAMILFLNELSGNPDLHISQVLGSYGTITVWLILRRPLPLRQILAGMEMVTRATARRTPASKGSETMMEVELGEVPSAAADP